MNRSHVYWLLFAIAALGGCAALSPPHRSGVCPLPARAGVPEYLCKHCNCIMQVAEGEWDHTCNVCNCRKTFKACLR